MGERVGGFKHEEYMEKIQVGYNRKEATDNYGSVGISGMVEFVPKTDDLQKEFDEMFLYLKMTVDAKAESIRAEKPVVVNNTVVGQPEEAQSAGADVNAQAEPEQRQVGKGEIFLSKAKVFRVDLKRDRKNNVYADFRIGHDDLEAHLADSENTDKHYISVKSWEPDVVSTVGQIKRMKDEESGNVEDVKTFLLKQGDIVDVAGKLNPWFNNPNVFDLNATALKINNPT